MNGALAVKNKLYIMENEPKKTRTRAPKKAIAVLHPDRFNWGKREFGIIAKSFETEDPVLQAQLIAISSELQIIKLNIAEQPLVIVYLLKKHYSSALSIFSEDKLFEMLLSGSEKILLNSELDAETLPGFLTNLSGFIASLSDTQWNAFWDGMFKAIAAPLTQWEKVCVYAPYVYNVLVKPVIK